MGSNFAGPTIAPRQNKLVAGPDSRPTALIGAHGLRCNVYLQYDYFHIRLSIVYDLYIEDIQIHRSYNSLVEMPANQSRVAIGAPVAHRAGAQDKFCSFWATVWAFMKNFSYSSFFSVPSGNGPD